MESNKPKGPLSIMISLTDHRGKVIRSKRFHFLAYRKDWRYPNRRKSATAMATRALELSAQAAINELYDWPIVSKEPDRMTGEWEQIRMLERKRRSSR